MKLIKLFLPLTLLFILVGCSDTSVKKKSSSSSSSPITGCAGTGYYCTPGCGGYNPQIASSTYCTTSTNNCTGTSYYCNTSCAGYNAQIAASNYCSGTTTGTTTTGTTGGGYTTIPSDNNWASLYPSGEPSGSCSTPTGTGYDLRKGTVTLSGGVSYSADLSWTGVGESEYTSLRYSHNVSSFLSSPTDAASFLDTDSVLRVRFKPRPQPKAPVGKSWCYGRLTGQSGDYWGYTKLRFTVAIKGSDGILRGATQVTTSVNSCSAAIDFSNHITSNGTLVIRDVYSDQGCTYQSGCTTWTKVRDASCWQMDVEVQVDGTKIIP